MIKEEITVHQQVENCIRILGAEVIGEHVFRFACGSTEGRLHSVDDTWLYLLNRGVDWATILLENVVKCVYGAFASCLALK